MALTADDRLAINELLPRYALAMDARDGNDRPPNAYDLDALREIFTEDCILDTPIGQFEGHQGLYEWTQRDEPKRSWHVITNFVVDDLGNDEASLRAYLSMPNQTYPHVAYDCIARKVNGVWRLSRRTSTVVEF